MPRSANAFGCLGGEILVATPLTAIWRSRMPVVQDPFVIGVDHFFEVGVGQKSGRHVGSKRTNLDAAKLAQ